MPGNKGLPEDLAKHVQDFVKDIIRREYTKSDGEPLPQRAIAEAMGIKQPVLNTILKGKGIGVHALLALRKSTGQSIDALLGFEMSERRAKNTSELDEIFRLIETVKDEVSRTPNPPGPYSKMGKALAALEAKRRHAAGQRAADEKLRQANAPGRRKGAA